MASSVESFPHPKAAATQNPMNGIHSVSSVKQTEQIPFDVDYKTARKRKQPVNGRVGVPLGGQAVRTWTLLSRT
jgi:hypothetical protein